MHGYSYFQMYLLEVIWHRITDCEKRSDMFDALSMYRPSEIILPEGTVLPQDIKRLYG